MCGADGSDFKGKLKVSFEKAVLLTQPSSICRMKNELDPSKSAKPDLEGSSSFL